MKLNEDYTARIHVPRDADGNLLLPMEGDQVNPPDPDVFEIEIINEEHPLYQWRFLINKIAFVPEETVLNEQTSSMNIDFDILRPSVLPDEFIGPTDEKITKPIGDAIIDLIIKSSQHLAQTKTQNDKVIQAEQDD